MVRVRIRFKKIGAVRFISHLDTLRAFERCFRSCDLPMLFTKGYHPHPRIALGPPLKTGWEGLDEYLDLFVEEVPGDIIAACNETLPEGLSLVKAAIVPVQAQSLTAGIAAARLKIVVDEQVLEENGISESAVRDSSGGNVISGLVGNMDPLAAFDGSEGGKCASKNAVSGSELLDLTIEVAQGRLSIEYLTAMDNGRGLSPAAMLERIFPESGMGGDSFNVIRKGLYIRKEGRYVSPLEVS